MVFNVMTAGCLADIPHHSATSTRDTQRVELSLPAELLTTLLPPGSHLQESEGDQESLTPHIITTLTSLTPPGPDQQDQGPL